MTKKLYVGNLPWSVSSSELEDVIRNLGLTCEKAEVIFDRELERSRGFAFVHFGLDELAEAAREMLDGYLLGERTLVANFATSERREKPRSGRRDPSKSRDKRRSSGEEQSSRGGRGNHDWEGR